MFARRRRAAPSRPRPAARPASPRTPRGSGRPSASSSSCSVTWVSAARARTPARSAPSPRSRARSARHDRDGGRHVRQHADLRSTDAGYGSPPGPLQRPLGRASAAARPASDPARHQRDDGLPEGQHAASGGSPRPAARPASGPWWRPRCAARSAPRGAASTSRRAPSRRRPPPARAGWRRRAARGRSYQVAAARCSCGTRSGASCLQAGAQQVGEQVVVAPPPALLVQRDQEQVGRARPTPAAAGRPARPITASHSGPDSRSRTDVSSRNARSSGGLPLEHLLGRGSPGRTGGCRRTPRRTG